MVDELRHARGLRRSTMRETRHGARARARAASRRRPRSSRPSRAAASARPARRACASRPRRRRSPAPRRSSPSGSRRARARARERRDRGDEGAAGIGCVSEQDLHGAMKLPQWAKRCNASAFSPRDDAGRVVAARDARELLAQEAAQQARRRDRSCAGARPNARRSRPGSPAPRSRPGSSRCSASLSSHQNLPFIFERMRPMSPGCSTRPAT